MGITLETTVDYTHASLTPIPTEKLEASLELELFEDVGDQGFTIGSMSQ